MYLLRIFFMSTAILVLSWPVNLPAAGTVMLRVATDWQHLLRGLSLPRDVVSLQEFLSRVEDINRADPDGMTLLHYAALHGMLPPAAMLRHLGAKANLADQRGLLPADYAEFGGHLEVKQFLSGTSPYTVNLFIAAAMNSQRALDRLLAKDDTDINARTTDGKTALHLSAELGNLYATKRLIDAGADISAKDNEGKLPLDLALDGEHALVVSVLLEAVDLNAKEHLGWTALNWAILSGNKTRVRELVAKGAKIGEGCQNAIELCLLLEDMEMFDIVRAAGGVDAANSRGDTALMGVSRRGDERIVDILLANQANTNVADKQRGYTPLRLAAENNHRRIVKKLIANKAKLDTVDILGDTALIRASLRGNVGLVQDLIDAGADLNIAGAGGMTALMWAVYWEEKETAQALLAGGADVSITNNAGLSALAWAVLRNKPDLLQLVLDNFDNSTDTGQADLRHALRLAVQREDKDLQKILLPHLDEDDALAVALQQQADLVPRDMVKDILIAAQQNDLSDNARLAVAEEQADYHLQWIINNDRPDILEKLLQLPFDLDAPDANGFNPVMHALRKEPPVLEMLLSHGADPNVLSNGFPPIISATISGNKDAVKTLLYWRANLEATDSNGNTALMRAAAGGYFEIAELLLLAGADPHHVNEKGEDALTLAARGEHQDIANMLRKAKGVEASLLDNANRTALQLAQENKQTKAVELLQDDRKEMAATTDVAEYDNTLHLAVLAEDVEEVKHLLADSVDINTRDSLGRTAMHYAALKGNEKLLNLLLDKQAEFNLEDNFGNTPAMVAQFTQQSHIVELLERWQESVAQPEDGKEAKLKDLRKAALEVRAQSNTSPQPWQ